MKNTSVKKNKIFFYISLFDMFVEILYKIMTNVKMLVESGSQMTQRVVSLLLTLMPYAINRCNSYWNQYFNPTHKNSERFRLHKYVDSSFYWFFMLLVSFVVCSKMIVDYRHIQATVIVYIMSKVAVGFYLSWFFYVFVISALLESFIASVNDWYTNYTGLKTAPHLNIFTKKYPIRIKLARLLDDVKTALNFLNNCLEAVYNVLLLYFDSSFLYACILGPITVIASFYSSYIKNKISNKQNINAGKESTVKNLLFEIITLFLFAVMVLTPFVQIHVIIFNVASFFSLPINSVLSYCIATFICLTFVLHKYIQKGDQVFKYLYGLNYASGYSMFGNRLEFVANPNELKRRESQELLGALTDSVYGYGTQDRVNPEDEAMSLFKTKIR